MTGTAAGQYASFERVVSEAIDQYNTKHSTSFGFADVWNANSTRVELEVADDGGSLYTKYYPTYADTVSCQYFYNLATNADTTLTSGLRGSSYILTSTLNGVNPDGVGAVFAWEYGSGVTASGAAAVSAAQSAASSVSATSTGYPRLIMGCSDGMNTTNAMGKRYCFDVIGITLV